MSKTIVSTFVAALFAAPVAAATFEAIKGPACIDSAYAAGLSFSKGEQYNDTNNGVLADRWFMLARWQGQSEQNFVSNNVIYDIGAFTGLHGAYQRGVSPERSDGTAGVQLKCYDAGMLINTWTVPHRPVVGGSYNDMLGYWFSPSLRVSPFKKNGLDTDLVLQANIAVPNFNRVRNTTRTEALAGQVGFFAYLRDTTHPASPPIAIIASTHMSNMSLLPGYLQRGSVGYDYSGAMTNAAKSDPTISYWFANTPTNGYGVWFTSAPIADANDHRYVTKVYSQGDLQSDMQDVSDLSTPLLFWRAHITPSNLINIVTDINAASCQAGCPPRPAGGYSL
jgi:hypothetical protein